jgi:hypothetical protein
VRFEGGEEGFGAVAGDGERQRVRDYDQAAALCEGEGEEIGVGGGGGADGGYYCCVWALEKKTREPEADSCSQ